MLKDVFGLAEYQENATYILSYELTLTKSKIEAVLDKAQRIDDTRIKFNHIHWYVPRYTPSIQQQGILSKENFRKTPTERKHIERFVFAIEVKNRNLW